MNSMQETTNPEREKAHLILVRHGQSLWNLENRFTGWQDVPLSDQGIEEAKAAGKELRGLVIDLAFTSVLKRAEETLLLILDVSGQPQVPVSRSPALNERSYGSLEGLDKTATSRRYGAEQVQIWRRSFDVAPPGGESLEDTYRRSVPYFEKAIAPQLDLGKRILVVAHGNSLRALVMHLEKLSAMEIVDREIPTGKPLYYAWRQGTGAVPIR